MQDNNSNNAEVTQEQFAAAVENGRRAVLRAAEQAAAELPEKIRPFVANHVIATAWRDRESYSDIMRWLSPREQTQGVAGEVLFAGNKLRGPY
jgi:hypothetical protein